VDVLVLGDVYVLVAGGGVEVCCGTVGGGVVVVAGKQGEGVQGGGFGAVGAVGDAGVDESAIADAATQPRDPRPMSERTVKTRAIMTQELRCGPFPSALSGGLPLRLLRAAVPLRTRTQDAGIKSNAESWHPNAKPLRVNPELLPGRGVVGHAGTLPAERQSCRGREPVGHQAGEEAGRLSSRRTRRS
jgi:hypothetical protein